MTSTLDMGPGQGIIICGHMILHHMMTQYHFNCGLEFFGEQGAAVLAKLQQRHVRDVIEQMHANELSVEEVADALQDLMLLK